MDQRAPKANDEADLSRVAEEFEESTDPDYLAWRDEKVRAVLERKRRGDQRYYTIDEVSERLGVKLG